MEENICLNWGLELEQYWLRDEDFASFGTEIADLGFQKLNLLARSTAPDLQEPINYGVKVYIILIRHLLLPTMREEGWLSNLGERIALAQMLRLFERFAFVKNDSNSC